MSLRIKDATPVEELQDHLLFAVGNTEGDTDGCVSLGQVKDYVDSDKATVAFTGSYLNLSDTPNLESYVQMTTLQQNYYTRNQINHIISGISGPVYKKVEELPEEGENNVIYLLPQEGSGQQNIFDEYIWIPDGLIFEKIGSTEADFDNYYTIDEVDALIPSVYNSTITFQQGGVTKGTITLNQSSAATINFDESYEQEQADWDVEDPTAVDYIKNKPTIPTLNDPTMTFTQGGVTKGTFTLNQSQAETIEFDSQVQADWEQEDNSELDYIKNKPDTLRLLFEYDDNTGEYIDFYIKGKERFIDYFYIKNEYAGQNTITLTTRRGDFYNVPNVARGVAYSKDKTNWTSVSLMPNRNSTITTNITLEEGERVYFRNSNGYFNYIPGPITEYWYTTITGSQLHSAGGNLKTLLSYDSDVNVPVYAFKRLFQNNTNLTKSPELPTTEFGGECFYQTFEGCTALTTPPTTISTPQMGANSCAYMFRNCSSLTTVPTLPSTNLNDYCYLSLFNRCTSLRTVPSDLLPATTLYQGCYSGLFYNCSGLNSTPELPATTLQQSSYQSMFKGCSLVNSIKIYADDISATDCLTDWLDGVASTGTFHNLGSATYSSGVSGIPSGWTEVNS